MVASGITRLLRFFILVLGGIVVATGARAVEVVLEDDKIVQLKGVEVAGKAYDVHLLDVWCADLACTAPLDLSTENLAFQTLEEATAASEAIEALFEGDGILSGTIYDSNPYSAYGCEYPSGYECNWFTIFSAPTNSLTSLLGVRFRNLPYEDSDTVIYEGPNSITPTGGQGATYLRWYKTSDLDSDNDGIIDVDDNCPLVANPDQSDADSDQIGDLCDENKQLIVLRPEPGYGFNRLITGWGQASMNSKGIIAGSMYYYGGSVSRVGVGFYADVDGWQYIRAADLGLNDWVGVFARGINDQGVVFGNLDCNIDRRCGDSFTYNIYSKEHRIYPETGNFYPFDMDNSGMILGRVVSGPVTSPTEIPAILNSSTSEVRLLSIGGSDMNSQGNFVGRSLGVPVIGNVYEDKVTPVAGYEPASLFVYPHSISECDQIAVSIDNTGTYTDRQGRVQRVADKYNFGLTRINSVNCSGTFVGSARPYVEDNKSTRAIMSTTGNKYQYLCDLYDCSAEGKEKISLAIKINEAGDIFGSLSSDSGESPPVWLLTSRVGDFDKDGIENQLDNCVYQPNFDQRDTDLDSIGDICDSDLDGDGVNNENDNCPELPNAEQEDSDSDGIGDVCASLDQDLDGLIDSLDNCPKTSNPFQENSDNDAFGDACDLDDDNDGIADEFDNCPLVVNLGQEDNEGDNIGDVCDSDDDNDAIEDTVDNCPFVENIGQEDNDSDGFGDVCDSDDDNDLIEDQLDNCPLTSNPDQTNTDGVGAGDACNDAFDLDDDDWENDFDNCPHIPNRSQTDFDGDGIGDVCDSDVDGDNVLNTADVCEFTPLGALIGSSGCSLEQLCPCDTPSSKHSSLEEPRPLRVLCNAGRLTRSPKKD
jgi:hypothetical protein